MRCGRLAGQSDHPLSADGLSSFRIVIKTPEGQHVLDQRGAIASRTSRRENMRKTVLTILGSALIAISTVQWAAAAERHHAHKLERAAATQQYRNANGSMAAPSQSGWYSEGGAISAPAGH
jgi:hypothetical protein